MIRFEKIIGDIYNLGMPRKTMTQAQNDIINFLSGNSCYYTRHWNIPTKYIMQSAGHECIFDHIDAFKNYITLIPYITTDMTPNIDEILKSNIRVKLCMKYGLQYKIINPNPMIFSDPKFVNCTRLIILHSDNWPELRKNVIRELYREYKTEWKRKFDEEN